jgi:hypothetical protein
VQTVKEFPYLVISWDQECRSVILQWRGGFVRSPELREGLLFALAEFKKRRSNNAQWIADTTDFGALSLEEIAWAEHEFQPMLLATGVQYMAFVQPRSAVAKLSMKQIVTAFNDKPITIYNCATLAEARQWMKQQKF